MKLPFLSLALAFALAAVAHAHPIGDTAHDPEARHGAREFVPLRVALLRTPAAEGMSGSGAGVGSPLFAPGTASDHVPRRSGTFVLRSPAIGPDGILPVEFTGDGASISPPLEWAGAPEGTRSFAVIMHHLAPDGEVKWYWTLYNIPAALTGVPKDARDIGTLGNNSVTRRAGYAPPHSKGPGTKTYVLTAYALSAPVQIATAPAQVNREILLAAMKDLILDSAELKVTYTRPDGAQDDVARKRQRGKR